MINLGKIYHEIRYSLNLETDSSRANGLYRDLLRFKECSNNLKNLNTRIDANKCTNEIGDRIYEQINDGLITLNVIVITKALIDGNDSGIRRVGRIETYLKSNTSHDSVVDFKRVLFNSEDTEVKSDPVHTDKVDRTTAFIEWMKSEGIIFYGYWWCHHCYTQRMILGPNHKLIYVECAEPPIPKKCDDVCNDGVPAWIIRDKIYVGEKTIEELMGM